MSSVAHLLRTLSRAGVRLDPGLSAQQVDELQDELGFRFADEHAALLRAGVPGGAGWPDWHGSSDMLRRALDAPVLGLVDDVQRGFWVEEWGDRPADIAAAIGRVRDLVAEVSLVPVYGHRYLAGTGGPVFSIYGTDVVEVGATLAQYLGVEFAGRVPRRSKRGAGVWSAVEHHGSAVMGE